jgi:MoaA/NifB/PqqE/SkfB family radical SAM enzyme
MSAVYAAVSPVSSKSIFSYRDELPHGREHCRAGILRPFIGADGNLYPCNSVQILRQGAVCNNPPECSLGHWTAFDTIPVFDGRACARCFYDQVNDILDVAQFKPEHLEFV